MYIIECNEYSNKLNGIVGPNKCILSSLLFLCSIASRVVRYSVLTDSFGTTFPVVKPQQPSVCVVLPNERVFVPADSTSRCFLQTSKNKVYITFPFAGTT